MILESLNGQLARSMPMAVAVFRAETTAFFFLSRGCTDIRNMRGPSFEPRYWLNCIDEITTAFHFCPVHKCQMCLSLRHSGLDE